LKNRIDILPGTSGKTVVCIAGWATGPALFDRLFPDDRRVVITPFYPATVVQDLQGWMGQDGGEIAQVVGVSMGVPLAIQFAQSATPMVPVIGIGANPGFDPAMMDAIATMVRRSSDAYLSQFWRSCVGVPEDGPWIAESFLDVGWSVDHLIMGLEFLKWSWGETLLSERIPHLFIHGSTDGISQVGIMSEFAETYGLNLQIVDGVGHLPLGPYSVERWIGCVQ